LISSVEHELEHELVTIAVLGDQAEKDSGGLLSRCVVVSGGPGGHLSVDVGLDGSAVEEPVLSGNLGDLQGALQDFGPGEDGLEVGLDVLDLLARADSVRKHPDEVADVTSELHKVEVLDVAEGLLGVLGERLKVGHAALKLDAVVVSSETLDETSGEVRDELLERREGTHLERVLWHEGESHISGHFTDAEVVGAGVIGLLSVEIFLDMNAVEEPVL